MVATAEPKSSNRWCGGQLAEAASAGRPDTAHRHAELLADLLVTDWRIYDEQIEKGAMGRSQLGKSVPHSSSALGVQHLRIDLAAAGGRMER